MILEQAIFKDRTKNITASHQITHPDIDRLELPLLSGIEGGNINTTWNEYRLGFIKDSLKGTLDTIENVINYSWAQLQS
jgi:hypothetical protein